MKLYNSETRTVEEFIPRDKNNVTMYTCGPTVYHYAHIGNLRSYIFEDVLQRALDFLGYKVNRAMNITDVGHLSSDGDTGEDKMLKGAAREHKTVLEIAEFYTKAFKDDFAKLNLKWPEIVVPASSCIDTYIDMIQTLIDKGYAYISGNNVYFDTSKLDKYYRLTNQESRDLMVGVRDSVEEDSSKRNKNDFVLWFTKSKFQNQELKWESPWGLGYPGWHIECSGISCSRLGEYLDIHCGGVDNKFPHHTNEIAQTEGYVGHKWCRYWFHVEHLLVATGKMSKSSGEFLTVSKLEEKGYSPMHYKMFCLQSHYRRQLVFTYEGLDSAKSALNKVYAKINALKADNSPIDQECFDQLVEKFKNSLSNDLNTSLAITCVFDVLKANTNDNTKLKLLSEFDKVLGLGLTQTKIEEEVIDAELEGYILEMIEKRRLAKLEKNYALADEIRNTLLEKNIELIDTKEGTKYKIK